MVIAAGLITACQNSADNPSITDTTTVRDNTNMNDTGLTDTIPKDTLPKLDTSRR